MTELEEHAMLNPGVMSPSPILAIEITKKRYNKLKKIYIKYQSHQFIIKHINIREVPQNKKRWHMLPENKPY